MTNDMDPLTLAIVIGGAIVFIGLFWLVGKFFFRLLKHVIMAAIIGVVIMVVWYQQCARPPRDPNVGKRAYAVGTDQYLGVVVGSGKDTQLGDVWYVELDKGIKHQYRKSRVILKDQ